MDYNFTVADFAESLISNGKVDITETIVKEEPKAPDISKIKIDEDFMNEVYSKSFEIKKEVKSKKIDTISQIQNLIKELQEVVNRGKQIIQEMTSVGALGVNMAVPKKPVSKCSPKKSKRVFDPTGKCTSHLKAKLGLKY